MIRIILDVIDGKPRLDIMDMRNGGQLHGQAPMDMHEAEVMISKAISVWKEKGTELANANNVTGGDSAAIIKPQ